MSYFCSFSFSDIKGQTRIQVSQLEIGDLERNDPEKQSKDSDPNIQGADMGHGEDRSKVHHGQEFATSQIINKSGQVSNYNQEKDKW